MSTPDFQSPDRHPRARLLAALWLLSGLLMALPGWLLLVLSEGGGGRVAGIGMATVALLALLTGLRVWWAGARAVPMSLGMSGLTALAGVGAVIGVAVDGHVFVRDALLLGGLPLAAAAVTAAMAARRARPD